MSRVYLPICCHMVSYLKTEIHIPVVVIQSCIRHAVLLFVRCSKPTAHTQNNLQSIMLDHQTLWHWPQPQKISYPKTLVCITQNLLSLCLVSNDLNIPHLQYSTFQLYASVFLVTPTKQSKLNKLQTWSCVSTIMWAVAQDLATQSHTVCKIIPHNSPPKFLIASTAGLLNKWPHIPHTSYCHIKQLTELQTFTSYTEMQTRDYSGTI